MQFAGIGDETVRPGEDRGIETESVTIAFVQRRPVTLIQRSVHEHTVFPGGLGREPHRRAVAQILGTRSRIVAAADEGRIATEGEFGQEHHPRTLPRGQGDPLVKFGEQVVG